MKDIRYKSGFSLIEFLLVVVFIMILAAGLILAVNPFEFLRQMQDKKYFSAATEFWKANSLYLNQRGVYPWGRQANFTSKPVSEMTDEIAELVKRNLLRDSFATNPEDPVISKLQAVLFAPTKLAVCFLPQSDKYKADSVNITAVTSGTNKGSCKPPLSPEEQKNCYYCVR